MKTKEWISVLTELLFILLLILLLLLPLNLNGQSEKSISKKYLSSLPVKANNSLQKYRMVAVYTNRDLYGKFTSKTRVTGDYTRGLSGDSSMWNNVYVSASNVFAGPFPEGNKQVYMENFKYIPSEKMLDENNYSNFPSSPENIYARNLIWDMLATDIFAWKYNDSLKVNQPYIIPTIKGEFKMADIGNYSHNKIALCWRGITMLEDQLCALIDFTAVDNLVNLNLNKGQIKTKGTEQYWGTILVSLKNREIEKADMYSGTIQEIEVQGMKDKFLMKTIRELEVYKIR